MPANVEFVRAGGRLGWRWTNCISGSACETVWLNPEPNTSEDGYEKYTREAHQIQKDVNFFRGFSAPPSEGQHRQRSTEMPLISLTILICRTVVYND